ncbi:CapA family protein [Nocardiopsis metallicus]|uniref:Poly-gamma-glutamate synthesis protein (Capsule biosynthesis protein) n=1 Tax=Nocardiopsis metallicus TaxID=179819 RepID=A0A840W2I3_9ACTN|nr:CapA family protein [Nocardiopsis metallicus]MBB5491049.1 poly-gamma-glutamate synthesis protein (capsule biosynthesis protein) [Nocardiopsis metallicus]
MFRRTPLTIPSLPFRILTPRHRALSSPGEKRRHSCPGRRAANQHRRPPGPTLAAIAALTLAATSCNVPEPEHTAVGATPGEGAEGEEPLPRTLSVLGAGDILVHSSVWEQAKRDGGGEFDFAPMFEGISPVLTGTDLALCHLEVPLAPAEGPFTGYPVFSAPPQVADGIAAAGYDGCSTASNHTLDMGEGGVVRTLEGLEAAGLGAAGSARTEDEALLPQVYEVAPADGGEPVPVAHLSYTYGFNGFLPPEGKEWMGNLIDETAILDEAARAREAGAEIVVLSMHWGTEYSHETDEYQRDLSDLVTSDDIDLILGTHAHVVQPMERIGDDWVVYGMGNQIAGQKTPPIDSRREGVMARIQFTETAPGEWESGPLEAIPTWVELDPGLHLVNLADALADVSLPESDREVYQAAHDRIMDYVDGLGVSEDPDFGPIG